MLKQTLALVGITLSLSANAATVSYNGYSLDTDANIVTGGGLEWLQWDVTVGQTIDNALANYATDGWGIATNTEMADLFNSFPFGVLFDTSENTNLESPLIDDEYSFGVANQFIALFGDTYAAAGNSYDYGDEHESTYAWFGTDRDGDNNINRAFVSDEYTSSSNVLWDGRIALHHDGWGNGTASAYTGVALVRTSVVPIPTSIWLFGSGLIALIRIAKRN